VARIENNKRKEEEEEERRTERRLQGCREVKIDHKVRWELYSSASSVVKIEALV
jgi:hypothetical protein